MEDWGWTQRLGYGAVQAAGLGFVAGALEVVGLAAGSKLPLTTLDMLVVGLVDVLLMGAVAAVIGLLAGVPIHLERREDLTSRAVSQQLAATGSLLCGLFLWQGAATLYLEDQPVGATAMALMPIGFAGVVFYNARYWLRRAELGRAPGLPWLAAAGAVSMLIVLGASLVYPRRDTGGTYALEGDRNVVVITVDGLRHDDEVPSISALADEGMTFLDAVTPSPHDTPANATVLTGLHPLRHRVLVDGDTLARGYRGLPEVLEAEGYATGGFVSSRAVGTSTGLSQGFRVFDDDFTPVAGIGRINLIGHAITAWLALTDADGTSSLHRRDPEATVDRFVPWLDAHHPVPFLAWIHLSGDPAQVDAAVGRVRAALEAHAVLEETLVIVAGSHGRMAGEHGITGAKSLYDPAIRVPLVVRAPDVRVDVPRIEPQVRLMDVSATALDWLRLDPLGQSEGISLITYGQGLREATIWCALVGQGDDGQLRLGMRNNGLKYVRDPDGAERLYDLATDPGEQRNLAESQPKTIEQARRLLASEEAALESLLAGRGRAAAVR